MRKHFKVTENIDKYRDISISIVQQQIHLDARLKFVVISVPIAQQYYRPTHGLDSAHTQQ